MKLLQLSNMIKELDEAQLRRKTLMVRSRNEISGLNPDEKLELTALDKRILELQETDV